MTSSFHRFLTYATLSLVFIASTIAWFVNIIELAPYILSVVLLAFRVLATHRTLKITGEALTILLSLWIVSQQGIMVANQGGITEMATSLFLLGVFNGKPQNTGPLGGWALFLYALFTGIGCIILSAHPVTYALFICLLASSLLFLHALFLWHQSDEWQTRKTQLRPWHFVQLLWGLPAGLLIAGTIFFLFPRINTFALNLNIDSSRKRTGYSGGVFLTGGGAIDESTALAFRVSDSDSKWLQTNSSDIYFRGQALEGYDKGVWKALEPESYKDYAAGVDLKLNQGLPLIFQNLQVIYEPLLNKQILYPGNLLGLYTNRVTMNNIEGDACLKTLRWKNQQPGYAKIDFQAAFLNTQVDLKQDVTLRGYGSILKNRALTMQYNDKSLAALVSLPGELRDAKWFKSWADSVAPLSPDMPVTEATDKIIQHFGSYRANLLNAFSKKNTLESFLTVEKAGHCEYFASATVLWLRFHGIPARVVVGYRGGHFNTRAQVLEVREMNAHAWVEYFHPSYGWLSLEATPTILLPPNADFFSDMKDAVNAMSYYFNRYVVDYDMSTQLNLWEKIAVQNRTQSQVNWDYKSWVMMMRWPVIAVIALTLFYLMRRRTKRSRDSQLDYYARFLTFMSDQGFPKQPAESVRHFHARIREQHDPALLEELTQLVESDLYHLTATATVLTERAHLVRRVCDASRALQRGS